MGLGTYIVRRLLLFIPILFGVTLLIFALLQSFTPTMRASLYVKGPREATPENIARIIAKYHLDDPVPLQFFHWLSSILQGDFGYSEFADLPVLVAITSSVPVTVELVMFAIPSTILLGIYLGVKSAVHQNTWVDHGTRMLSIMGMSLPSFFLGLILVAVFYGGLGWVSVGRLSNTAHAFATSDQFVRYTGIFTIDGLLNGQLWITLDALQHLILPTITLTAVQVALIVRVTRSSMLEALGKTYVAAARAKGLTKTEVINKHARKNALIPVVTVAGVVAAAMMNGVVITETIFEFQGLGYFAANSAMGLDIAGVVGFALVAGITFSVANLLVDVIYGYLDPRIRLT